jgi:hypothetical protein
MAAACCAASFWARVMDPATANSGGIATSIASQRGSLQKCIHIEVFRNTQPHRTLDPLTASGHLEIHNLAYVCCDGQESTCCAQGPLTNTGRVAFRTKLPRHLHSNLAETTAIGNIRTGKTRFVENGGKKARL